MKKILVLAIAVAIAGAVWVSAQQGVPQTGASWMMSQQECVSMMKQMGMPDNMITRCRMFGQVRVEVYDPASVLTMKDELQLSAEQVTKLNDLISKSREEAKAVLTEDQKVKLQPLSSTPSTMQEMWEKMHAQMQDRDMHPMMMCPWMGQ